MDSLWGEDKGKREINTLSIADYWLLITDWIRHLGFNKYISGFRFKNRKIKNKKLKIDN